MELINLHSLMDWTRIKASDQMEFIVSGTHGRTIRFEANPGGEVQFQVADNPDFNDWMLLCNVSKHSQVEFSVLKTVYVRIRAEPKERCYVRTHQDYTHVEKTIDAENFVNLDPRPERNEAFDAMMGIMKMNTLRLNEEIEEERTAARAEREMMRKTIEEHNARLESERLSREADKAKSEPNPDANPAETTASKDAAKPKGS